MQAERLSLSEYEKLPWHRLVFKNVHSPSAAIAN